MEKTIQGAIEILYGAGMIAVMFFLVRMILRARIDIITPLIVLFCWIAGEIMIHREPMAIGIALYSSGNALLFLYGARITGLGMSRGVTLALLPVFLVSLTGYFAGGKNNVAEPFLILNTIAIYLFIINGIIFTRVQSQNRWFYGTCFALLALWNGGLMIHYLRTGRIITDYGHPFMLACKTAMALILVTLAIRFYLQSRGNE